MTPKDVLCGVPFHKNLTKITWPIEEGNTHHVSNTKTINVSVYNFNGQKIVNPLNEGKFL